MAASPISSTNPSILSSTTLPRGWGTVCSSLPRICCWGARLVWWLVGPPPGVFGWAAAVLAALLALLLDFCISALIGLAAFIAEEVSAFRWIYQKFLLVLGGLLIPLDFFPEWLQNVSRALPFAWIVYGPARLFVDPSATRLADVLLHQMGWLLGTGIVVALFYRWVVGQLTINGG